MARLDAGDVEDIVHQREQMVCAFQRGAQIFAALHVPGCVHGEARHAHDGVHGGANLVAHGGQELALGAVGGLGCVARLQEGPLRYSGADDFFLKVDVGYGQLVRCAR
nr:hypothetical protein [uncultured Cohaesibacter sp.]